LRGFRIELGEIESTLRQYEAVEEAVVVLYRKDDKPESPRLAAYVTLTTQLGGEENLLHAWLKSRLPEYMIPAGFTMLEEFPLTPNGKIDRKALPEPDLSIRAEHQEPRTETEQLLCILWSQVLRSEVTSINTHFFEAGGYSLLITQLVSRIRESFGIEIPLRELFEQPILRKQAAWLDKQQRNSELPSIRPLADGEPLVLSFAQQRWWFLAQLEGQSATYNTTAALNLEGRLNVTALEQTLTSIIQRHHNLRLCFPVVDGEATVQLNDVYNPLRVVDLSQYPETEQHQRVTESIARHAQTPFDLSTGPLLSALLLKLGEQDHVFLFNMHHIISDGWSTGVLIRELSHLYNAYAQEWAAPTANKWVAPTAHKGEPGLPELPIQYTDYAAWQRGWLEGEVLDRQLSYWTGKLAGAPELLELPTDYPRPAIQRYRGTYIRHTLEQELSQGIKQVSRQHGVTVFMTLMAAFTVLMARYSGQTDIMVGTPIANRTHHHTEDLIGFFVNTLVLRTHINGEQRFSELLKQVKQTALEAYSHQDIPFEYLVEQLNPVRRLSHSPLFQVILELQNAPEETLELTGLKLSSPESRHTVAKFDLTLTVREHGNGFVWGWEYNTDLFRPETISRMSHHFQVLLKGILQNPEQSLYQIPVITEVEKDQLMEWNRTEVDYPLMSARTPGTIVDLFGEQVEKTPDHAAVVFEEQQLGYLELDRKSDRLAYDLMMLGVGPETLIVILARRSIDFLIAVLGIFKAGGAYLPLNPAHPVQRIRQVLADSEVPFILTANEFQPTAAQAADLNSKRQPRILGLEDLLKTAGTEKDLPPHRSPGNLAYVIYTSGSTGIPKGVMLEHRGMLNHLYAKIDALDLTANDSVVQNASQTFDISVWQFLAILMVGGCVHIFNDETASDPLQLLRQVAQQKLTVLEVVPSFLRVMLEEVVSRPDTHLDLSHLRWLIPTGEALPPELCIQWLDSYPDTPLLNAYGPTECSDDVSHYRIDRVLNDDMTRIPIGKPVNNMRLYVLDTYLQLVPIGIAGELYVAGTGVGRGYLKDPQKTAETFIPDPFSHEPGARLYKTGDIACYLSDGNLDFLGRVDKQIKVRGFRIELSEIEVTMNRHEIVKEAVVLLNNQENNPRLIAYVTFLMPIDDAAGVLRTWLMDRLPEYMVPAGFMVLDKLPLTPNGKIDRNALSELDLTIQAEKQVPGTETERLLCILWSEVLNIEVTDIQSIFFEVGGTSLSAIRLGSRIFKTFGVKMPLPVLFEHPLLKDQAQWLDNQQQGSELPPIVPLAEGTPLVLSFAQQRLWFLAQLEGQSATYNITAALNLEGQLDVTALERTLTSLIKRHHSLRLCFPAVDGKATVQLNDVYNPLSVIDLSEYPETEQHRQMAESIAGHARIPFDLNTGPLLSTRLLKLGKREHILLFNMHHIIGDGWSMGILVREWSQLYNAYSQNQTFRLPPLAIQYTDYAAWQRSW
ncbi:MAG: amino acid adenylation domain-containing protein, partial [bacterium]|nr:amino acid adenylation domain-containing protein [bacterium]